MSIIYTKSKISKNNIKKDITTVVGGKQAVLSSDTVPSFQKMMVNTFKERRDFKICNFGMAVD